MHLAQIIAFMPSFPYPLTTVSYISIGTIFAAFKFLHTKHLAKTLLEACLAKQISIFLPLSLLQISIINTLLRDYYTP